MREIVQEVLRLIAWEGILRGELAGITLLRQNFGNCSFVSEIVAFRFHLARVRISPITITFMVCEVV